MSQALQHTLQTETLGHCPLCQNVGRRLEAAAVRDWVHQVVDGRWHYHRCIGCRCVYLDPRPTLAVIPRAYETYQTHEPPRDVFAEPDSLLRKVTRAVRDGDISARYGYRVKHTPYLGHKLGQAAGWVPPLRHAVDSMLRHAARTPGRVLDVGCGNGTFVATMQKLGWEAQGVEMDAASAALARGANLRVTTGTIADVPDEGFDLITLNHVVEHLHDPRSVLDACFAKLRSGGVVWVATPNIQGFGFRRFGRYWRGLEAPRHLVLFHQEALNTLLTRVGFSAVTQHRTPWWAWSQFMSSSKLRRDDLWNRWLTVPVTALAASVLGEVHPRFSEELLFTATKP